MYASGSRKGVLRPLGRLDPGEGGEDVVELADAYYVGLASMLGAALAASDMK